MIHIKETKINMTISNVLRLSACKKGENCLSQQKKQRLQTNPQLLLEA